MALLSSLMLLAATGSTPAQAQELVYDWPEDEAVHYRIQSHLYAPRILRFYSVENLDARVAEFTMGLLIKCKKTGVERKSVYVECDIHRAQMGGQAADGGEQQKLTKIFQEYVNVLDDSIIQLTLTPTGRIKTVDLEGPEKGTSRETMVHNDMRMILLRSLSALEIEMPKDGIDPGKEWKQKGAPLAMQLPTNYGTAGAIRMKHRVASRDGSLVNIQTTADGLVTPATASDSSADGTGASSGSTITVDMIADGSSTFDTERGLLTRGEMTVQGVLTASSSGVGDGAYLNQFVLTELFDNFDELDAAFEAMIAGGNLDDPDEAGEEADDAREAEEAAMEALRKRTAPEGEPEGE